MTTTMIFYVSFLLSAKQNAFSIATSEDGFGNMASIGIYKQDRVYVKKIKYSSSFNNTLFTKERLIQLKQVFIVV